MLHDNEGYCIEDAMNVDFEIFYQPYQFHIMVTHPWSLYFWWQQNELQLLCHDVDTWAFIEKNVLHDVFAFLDLNYHYAIINYTYN